MDGRDYEIWIMNDELWNYGLWKLEDFFIATKEANDIRLCRGECITIFYVSDISLKYVGEFTGCSP